MSRACRRAMDVFPFTRVVTATKEQRCHRPGRDFEAKKPFDSMMKNVHTPKVEVVVRVTGRVESVGPSELCGAKYGSTPLRESGLLGRVVTEKFPAFDPTRNLDEGVGEYQVRAAGHLAANDTDELWNHRIDERVTLRHSLSVLRGVVRQTKRPGHSLAI